MAERRRKIKPGEVRVHGGLRDFQPIYNWVIDMGLDPTELALYVILVRLRDYKKGRAHATLGTIGGLLGRSHDTVTRGLQSLQDKGVITITSGKADGTANVYTILATRRGGNAPVREQGNAPVRELGNAPVRDNQDIRQDSSPTENMKGGPGGGPMHDLIGLWSRAWKHYRGVKWSPSPVEMSKAYRAAKKLLSHADRDEIIERMARMLELRGDFWEVNASLDMLEAKWSQMAKAPPAVVPESSWMRDVTAERLRGGL